MKLANEFHSQDYKIDKIKNRNLVNLVILAEKNPVHLKVATF